MCWQCPGVGAGKTPSCILVRLKQQFGAVVLWYWIFFFFHFVEYKGKRDAERILLSGLQCGNKTRDGSREYSWECKRSLPGKWGWIGLEQIKQQPRPLNSVFRPSPSPVWLVSYSPSPGTVLATFQNDCAQCYKKPCVSDLVAIQKSISCY